MWRSGFLAFHISTSLSTMSLLPPLRSHITRSAAEDAAAAKLDANRPKASAPKAFDNRMMFLPFLPASAHRGAVPAFRKMFSSFAVANGDGKALPASLGMLYCR